MYQINLSNIIIEVSEDYYEKGEIKKKQKRYDGQTIFNFETYKELKDKFISIWPIFEINFEIEDNNLYISWCEVEKGYEPTENDFKVFENGIINLYNCCIIINEINKIESINDISQIPFE